MTFKDEYAFPDDLDIIENGEMVMFRYGDVKSGWIDKSDSFVQKITMDNLNPDRLCDHLAHELKIKNRLDEGVNLLRQGRFSGAVECFDDVIYYDSNPEAVMYKSRALFGQKHFVKALRYYKRAVRGNANLKDDEYYRQLLDKSRAERDNFPKIKLSIYTGDEFFSKGDYENAVKSYDRALANPSRFKDKILFRLLNKKAASYVKLNEFENAKRCFEESWNVSDNDCACFGMGYCRYMLGMDVTPCFRQHLEISKKHLLIKAEILAELGYEAESRKDYNEFLVNHFKNDDDYRKAIGGLD